MSKFLRLEMFHRTQLFAKLPDHSDFLTRSPWMQTKREFTRERFLAVLSHAVSEIEMADSPKSDGRLLDYSLLEDSMLVEINSHHLH